jgi:hypothetical protein
MATYFESGIGKAILHSDSANSAQLGRLAATQALAQLKRFQPSLALAFVSPELEIAEVSKGINDVLDGRPMIGTSTAGEIANGFIRHGIVTAILACPHYYRKAVVEALSVSTLILIILNTKCCICLLRELPGYPLFFGQIQLQMAAQQTMII